MAACVSFTDSCKNSGSVCHVNQCISVPARHISEGAAPCLYCLAPCPYCLALCPNYKNYIFFYFRNVNAVFRFSDRGVIMLVKCLQICAHVFIDRPQNCAHSCAGLRRNFSHSRSKLCPIIYVSFAHKIVPNLFCTLPLFQPSWNTVYAAIYNVSGYNFVPNTII